MRLEKLELVGFKSFVDRTVVSFLPGVTAIVGPNGCGKSNIADAIRWAMGELSAKQMRGERMEDVIFAGSDRRKPIGLAEVHLYLSGRQGELSPNLPGLQEVVITRRLHRSGESEYLLNKVPCRLKDIRDLLMDAGIGAKGYAFIEQGRVEQILNAKPVERRFLIDEVAGITKYRSQKAEAIQKLESTQQNLARVSDIVGEVKRQLNALDRQVKKAERYRKLQEELRDLELRLALIEYRGLAEAWAEVGRRHAALTDREAERSATLSRLEAEGETRKAAVYQAHRDLEERRQALYQADTAIQRMEGRLELLGSQRTQTKDRLQQLAGERQRLLDDRQRLGEEGSSLEQETREAGAALRRQEAALKTQQEEAQRLLRLSEEKEEELEEAKRSIYRAVAENTEVKNRIAVAETRLGMFETQAERGRSEQADAREQLAQIQAQWGEAESAGSRAEEERTRIRSEKGRLDEQAASVELERRALTSGMAAGKEDLAAKLSRLQSLREMAIDYEGYEEGVRLLLKQAENLSGLRGLVVDHLTTSPEYEIAVEAVLGERLQHFIADDHQVIRRGIAYLKERGAGRGTFIPKALREISAPHTQSSAAAVGDNGVVGSLLELVSFPEEYRPVMRYLLGHAVVVKDLETALTLWRRNGTPCTYVTIEGETLDPWGVVAGGGPGRSGERKGLLQKRRELRELEGETGRIRGEIAQAEETLERLSREEETLREERARLDEAHQRAEAALLEQEKALALLGQEKDRLTRKAEVLALEQTERDRERSEIEEALRHDRGHHVDLARRQAEAEARTADLQADLERVREQGEESREGVADARVAVTSAGGRLEELRRRRDRLQSDGVALGERVRSLEEEQTALQAKLTSASEEAEAIAASLKEEHERRGRLQGEIEAQRNQVGDLERRVAELEETIRADRRQLEESIRERQEVEIRRSELRLEMGHLQERVREQHLTTIEEAARRLGEFVLDPEEARGRAAELRQRIEALGPVNLAALEEHRELQERYTFLSTQHQDLVESVASLQQAIAKINQTTQSLFHEAFEAINAKFQEVFQILFEGGKAELSVVGEGDIFETGIEIHAQPPGKRLQQISLLSGGEKALTAAALLFACFLIKPSPLCVLDEVDAPLDDANIERFTRLLTVLSDRTQFLVVTHNKRTMETADILYGVTMEEPGISKVLSVKFNGAQPVAV